MFSRSTAEEPDYQLQITRDASYSTYRWEHFQSENNPNSVLPPGELGLTLQGLTSPTTFV